MLRKVMGVAAVAAGAVALALPAGATVPGAARTVDFGAKGSITMHYDAMSADWEGSATFTGLGAGNYVVRVSEFADSNHDGTPEWGGTADLCSFRVKHNQKQPATCSGAVQYPMLGAATDWRDINRGSVDRLQRVHRLNTATTVLLGDFR